MEAFSQREPGVFLKASKNLMMGSMLSRALLGSPRLTKSWASVSLSTVGQTMLTTSESLRVDSMSVPPELMVRTTVPLMLLIVPFFGSLTGLGGTDLSNLNGSFTSQRSPPLKMRAWPKDWVAAQRRAAVKKEQTAGRMVD